MLQNLESTGQEKETEYELKTLAYWGFGEEELDWLLEHLKKAVELEASGGFTRKIRGKTRTHLMEICFNSRGRFMKITEIVTKRKSLVLVVPEGVKGNGWETLRKSISRVQDVSDQAVRASKEKDKESQVSRGMYREGRSYADVVAEKGHRNGASMPVGRWARAVICESKGKILDWFDVGKVIARMMGTKGMVSVTPISEYKGCFFVDSARRAMWFQDQGSLTVRGGVVALRRWSPKENSIVGGKFRRKWGRVTKVAKETLKLVDLSKVKMWVEMHPKVVLPALLEVEDGAWSFTVAVSVIGEAEEDFLLRSESNRSKDEVTSAEGCVHQRPKNAEGLRATARDNEYHRWRPRHRSRVRNAFVFKASAIRNLCKGGDADSSVSKAKRQLSYCKMQGEELAAEPKVTSIVPKRNLDGMAHRKQIEALFGADQSSKRAPFLLFQKNPDASPGTEGDEGSRHATSLVSQRSPFPKIAVVEPSRLVGVSRPEGVAFPLETSNRNSKEWPLFKDSLSSPEKLCVSGKAQSPNPEHPSLPLEGFQVEGLTPGKMVKVQSVLES
ncbi:hypothetical protein CK203_032335 [Vitis vinifera]|uniref:DUF4283 domain-containing protein n=1 Tax=Vitis vinifera TaxID=29760 RepID=A0A438IK09_VITVI|nr:hypothetical protein CK203_032335 [Vitis vinifera]